MTHRCQSPKIVAAWLSNNLNMAKARMNIDISLHILLFSEAWPVSWQGALKFWDSKVMTDATLAPYLVETTFLTPPVKAFVKAGFGGIGILKKPDAQFYCGSTALAMECHFIPLSLLAPAEISTLSTEAPK